jgi:hypothetical protein
MEFYSADIEMFMSGWNTLYHCSYLPSRRHTVNGNREAANESCEMHRALPSEN